MFAATAASSPQSPEEYRHASLTRARGYQTFSRLNLSAAVLVRRRRCADDARARQRATFMRRAIASLREDRDADLRGGREPLAGMGGRRTDLRCTFDRPRSQL